jgi:hypothetical protein
MKAVTVCWKIGQNQENAFVLGPIKNTIQNLSALCVDLKPTVSDKPQEANCVMNL